MRGRATHLTLKPYNPQEDPAATLFDYPDCKGHSVALYAREAAYERTELGFLGFDFAYDKTRSIRVPKDLNVKFEVHDLSVADTKKRTIDVIYGLYGDSGDKCMTVYNTGSRGDDWIVTVTRFTV